MMMGGWVLSTFLITVLFKFSSSEKIFRLPITRVQEHSSVTHRARIDHQHRRLSYEPFEEVPLFGDFNALAYYYADIYVGTPPQKFTVIVDTGSTLTAVPCKGCRSCGTHMDAPFAIGQSSTSSAVGCGNGCSLCRGASRCGYSISYTEGSTLQGDYIEDIFWLGGEDGGTAANAAAYGVRYVFGCHSVEGGLFTSQLADGIMGIAHGTRDGKASNIMTSLWRAGKLKHNMFALCLNVVGGVYALGGYDASLHTASIQYTPLHLRGHFLGVAASSLSVDGVNSGASESELCSSGCIVDSGTSFTYLDARAYRKFKALWLQVCSRSDRCTAPTVSVAGEPTMCYTVRTPAVLATFPTVTLRLHGGVVITLPPLQAMFPSSAHAWCVGLYDNEGAQTVIGANLMRDHDVIVDYQQSRMGWVRANCAGNMSAPPPPFTPSPSPPPSPAPSPSGGGSSGGESGGGSSGPGADTPSPLPSRVPSLGPSPVVAVDNGLPSPSPSPSPSPLLGATAVQQLTNAIRAYYQSLQQQGQLPLAAALLALALVCLTLAVLLCCRCCRCCCFSRGGGSGCCSGGRGCSSSQPYARVQSGANSGAATAGELQLAAVLPGAAASSDGSLHSGSVAGEESADSHFAIGDTSSEDDDDGDSGGNGDGYEYGGRDSVSPLGGSGGRGGGEEDEEIASALHHHRAAAPTPPPLRAPAPSPIHGQRSAGSYAEAAAVMGSGGYRSLEDTASSGSGDEEDGRAASAQQQHAAAPAQQRRALQGFTDADYDML